MDVSIQKQLLINQIGEKLNDELKTLEEELKKLNADFMQEMKLKKTLDDNFSQKR